MNFFHFVQSQYNAKYKHFKFYYYFYFIIIIYFLRELPRRLYIDTIILTHSNVQSHTRRNSQLGHNWRQLGSVQFCRIGRCDRVYNPTQLNSTSSKMFRTCKTHPYQLESVEFSWVRVVRMIRTPEPIQLDWLSWVGSGAENEPLNILNCMTIHEQFFDIPKIRLGQDSTLLHIFPILIEMNITLS